MTFLYLDSNDDEFGPVAETVLTTFKSSGVKVQATYRWYEIYHHGYGDNPFDAIVERSFMDTRSKWIEIHFLYALIVPHCSNSSMHTYMYI